MIKITELPCSACGGPVLTTGLVFFYETEDYCCPCGYRTYIERRIKEVEKRHRHAVKCGYDNNEKTFELMKKQVASRRGFESWKQMEQKHERKDQ